MYRDKKIVVCIPVGRERYLRVLMPYLFNANRTAQIIDEIHLWVNTDEPTDIEYFKKLATYPKITCFSSTHLVKGVYDQSRNHYQYSDGIYQYYQLCTAENHIYFKIDDDISYIHPGFFERMADGVLNNNCFYALGNVLNIPMTSKIYQDKGLLDHHLGTCTGNPRCPVACTDGPFAEYLHNVFFEKYEQNKLDEFLMDDFDLWAGRHRIGAMAWRGESFARFNGSVGEQDEVSLTRTLPAQFAEPLRVCGKAFVAHFAFSHQRAHLEDKTNVLDRYFAISSDLNGVIEDYLPGGKNAL